MTRKTFSTWLICLFLAAAAPLEAKVTEVAFSELEPNRQHRQSALIITKVVDRFHYRKLPLDDALSATVFERYLESLDPNKSFFTAADIQQFSGLRNELDDALRTARLEPAFDVFKLFRVRVNERVARALAMLDRQAFDFSRPETYQFDREDAAWAADAAALDDLWRRRIKNDLLSLEVAGKKTDEARETLRKRYEGTARRVNQLTADDVFQTFINAYTLSIEPHTSYMSPRTSENFDISMRLSLQGIGAVLRSENEYTLVQNTVTGGPAERSGEIRAGDRIVGVAQGRDGAAEDVIGWRLQDVVELIRGPKGSVVRLTVLPKSAGPEGRTRQVVLVRDEIKLEDQAAKSEIIEGLPGMDGVRVGVIEIPAFYRDFRAQAEGENDFRSTTRDVRRLLAKLEAQGADGIVIDLRGNGGGALTEATELTGLFIEQGAVVQVRDSGGQVDVERDPDPAQVYKGPLAVLVDRNSASASEIFAGAIQDYRRGIVIGEPTYGKGTVQTLVDLGRFVQGDEDLGRLRLTMAQFFRINGGSTQHRGVVPDIVFPTASSAEDHGERSLDNALPWAQIDRVSYKELASVPLDALRSEHTRRIARDPGFIYLIEQEQDLTALRERDTVSLALGERQQEWRQRDQERLDRRNRLRAYRGLEPLTENGDDEEEVAESDDDPEGISRIMTEESARILADYIRLSRPLTAQAL